MKRQKLEKEKRELIKQFHHLTDLRSASKPETLYRNMPDTAEYQRAKVQYQRHCGEMNLDPQLKQVYDRIGQVERELSSSPSNSPAAGGTGGAATTNGSTAPEASLGRATITRRSAT